MRYFNGLTLAILIGCTSSPSRQTASEVVNGYGMDVNRIEDAPIHSDDDKPLLQCKSLTKNRIVVESKSNNSGHVSNGVYILDKSKPPTVLLKYVLADGQAVQLGHIWEDKKGNTKSRVESLLKITPTTTVSFKMFEQFGFTDDCLAEEARLLQKKAAPELFWCWIMSGSGKPMWIPIEKENTVGKDCVPMKDYPNRPPDYF